MNPPLNADDLATALTNGAAGWLVLSVAAVLPMVWTFTLVMSFLETFEAQIDETRGRIAAMADACTAIGRDPATLRRAHLMFDATARPRGGSMVCYESVDRFEDMSTGSRRAARSTNHTPCG